jgi:hypothetical protein
MHLAWLLWFVVLTPVVVHLHELGHAAAALRLTRDSVVVQACTRPVRAVGLGRLHIAVGVPALSGVCFHASAPGRLGNAKIAAAGPVVSLATGLVAAAGWYAWGGVPLGVFAATSLFTGVLNLVPFELEPAGSGLHAPRETDGRVILRSFGLAPARRADVQPPMIRAPFAVALGLIAAITAWLQPLVLLPLAATFGHAWYATRRARRPTGTRPSPKRPEQWETGRSVAPPGGR